MLWRLLCLLCLLSRSASQVSRRCYECSDMPRPSDCRLITHCTAENECVLEQVVTSGGILLYNSGCRSKERCTAQQRRRLLVAPRYSTLTRRSDLITCSECCEGDFCNDQGCGFTALRQPQRPALCFQCDAVVNPGLCRHIKRCDVDEVCMLTELRTRADNGDTLYNSGCVSPQVCRGYAAALVGKRKRMTYCHVCCHDDYCNDRCHVGVTPLPNTPTRTRPTTVMATSTTTRVDGGWGSWLPWSQCSQTCGGGSRSRARSCDNPAPAGGGNGCHGDSKENDTCNNQVCSDWGAWFYAPCSVTCGTGTKQAMRMCSSGHVEDCTGPSSKTENCTLAPCPVDGGWGSWSPWSQCSKTCGGGSLSRARSCDNPTPAGGGNNCSGDSQENGSCNNQACQDWTVWFYSPCSVTCGTGTKQAMRTCSSGHVEDCTGPSSKTETCTQAPCPGQPTNPPTNPPSTTVAPYTCFYNNEHYSQGQSWNDGCSQSCTCTDASIGTYSCRGRCLVWNTLPSVCTLEDAPGRCCQQPKCPTGILITIPKGFEKEYPGYTTDT